MGRTPAGIIILSLLFLFGGASSVMESIGSFFTLNFLISTFEFLQIPSDVILYFYIALTLNIVVSIFLIITGYGFLKIKKWAWKIGIVTLILNIIVQIAFFTFLPELLKEDLETLIYTIALVIYSSIILVYLFTPKVRSFFNITQDLTGEDRVSIDASPELNRYADRTYFKTQSNDESYVRKQIYDWVSRNKGQILTERSDGSRIDVGFTLFINPKRDYMVIKFKKTGAAIIFELLISKENNKINLIGEGYVPQIGSFELDLDPNSVLGGIPRRKGYKLLQELKSIIDPTSVETQMSSLEPHS